MIGELVTLKPKFKKQNISAEFSLDLTKKNETLVTLEFVHLLPLVLCTINGNTYQTLRGGGHIKIILDQLF